LSANGNRMRGSDISGEVQIQQHETAQDDYWGDSGGI
jgi:hypothetical protein